MSPRNALLLALALVASTLAGCLQPDAEEQPTLISRVHTLTFDRASMERAESHADPEDALAELLTSDLVVRVGEAGDYTLEYVDAAGTNRTQALPGLTPGTPATVPDVEPLAPATLKRGEETVATRAAMSGSWWRFGDMPLGVNLTPGSRGVYDVESRVEERVELRDIEVPEENLSLERFLFHLRLPMEGRVSWASVATATEGDEILAEGRFSIPADAGEILVAELAGSMEGESGTAGGSLSLERATANASVKAWIEGGQLVATQFLGGAATFDPKAYAWADGALAELGEDHPCAGKTKEDRCEPEEVEAFEEATGPTEKERIPEGDIPRAEDDDAREAAALLERIFAESIVRGDRASLVFQMDSEDLAMGGPDGPTGDVRAEFSLEAVAIEDVEVPAGKFRALKIVEETRTRMGLSNVKDEDGELVLRDLDLDETVARTTFWLDAETYQPIKMVAQTPLDLDALLKEVVDSLEPAAWEEIGGKPLTDDQWTITATGEASYELVESAPGARFSPIVALGLAHSLSGAFASVPSAFVSGLGGAWGTSYAEPVPSEEWEHWDDGNTTEWEYEEPEMDPVSLALTSAGPIDENGVKSYAVASASEGLEWGRLGVMRNGEELYPDWLDDCMPFDEMSFAACSAEEVEYDSPILAGDELRVMVEVGDTLQVFDLFTGATILTLKVS